MSAASGIRAGKAFVELGVDDRIAKGLQKAGERLKAFGEGVRSVGLQLGGLGAAALTFLGGTVKAFVDTGDALDEMSARTGVSVETLSELGWAADLAGADLETLETGLRKMQKVVTEAATGSASATDALGRLGLSVADLVNLNPEEQFKRIADRLSQIKDPTLRAAMAMEVFGKSGTRLLPLLANGAQGLEEYQRQAQELGLTISGDMAKDAAALADTLDTLWRVVKRSAIAIGAALAPTIKDLGDKVTKVIVQVTQWLQENQALIVTVLKVAAAVTAVGAGLVVAGTLISGLGVVCGWLASVVTGIGTALGMIGTALAALLSPIGLVIAAVVAVGGTLLVVTGAGGDAVDWLVRQFTWLRDSVSKVLGGIADALAAGEISLAAQILWLSLKVVWEQGAYSLLSVWLTTKSKFLEIINDFVYGGQALWVDYSTSVQSLWTRLVASLRSAWSAFSAWWERDAEESAATMAKWWIKLQGLFDSSLNVTAALESVDQQSRQQLAEIAAREQAEMAAISTERDKALAEAAQNRDRRLAEIGRDDQDNTWNQDVEHQERLRKHQADLEKAKADLAAAIAAAAKKRQDHDAGLGSAPGRPKLNVEGDLDERLSSLGTLMAQKISAIGTFNPAAVRELGASDVAQRTARATEETAKHTKKLADAAITGGLKFA